MRSVPTRMGASTFVNVTTEDLLSMQESLLGPTESQKAGTTARAGDWRHIVLEEVFEFPFGRDMEVRL